MLQQCVVITTQNAITREFASLSNLSVEVFVKVAVYTVVFMISRPMDSLTCCGAIFNKAASITLVHEPCHAATPAGGI